MKREMKLNKAAKLLPLVCIGLVLWVAMPPTLCAQEPGDGLAPSNTEKNESPADSEGEKGVQDNRLAVPEQAAISESMALVRDLFQSDFKAAKSDAKKSELAKKILQAGMETEDDVAGRFVLLRLARDIAAGAGDLETALEAIDQLEKSFKLDTLEMRVTVFDQMAPKARTVIKMREPIIEFAMVLIDQAIAEDQFETASRIRATAYSIASKMRDIKLLKQLKTKKKEIEDLAKGFEAVKAALAILETNPTDPEANLTVGKYRSYIKGDWATGLPMLVLGSDVTLQSLAKAELAMPETAAEQLKLGNRWWNLAEESSSTAKKQLQWRAAHWYEIALPELKGLSRTITEKRLASLPRDPGAGPTKTFFLDDLQEINYQVSRRVGKHGNLGWKNAKGTINGKVPEHALCVYPPGENTPSIVSYALNGRFESLDTFTALWDGSRPRSPMTFKVYGDGRMLWQSQTILNMQQAVQRCQVSLKGVHILKLQVDISNGKGAYAVWINPKVVGREKGGVKSTGLKGAFQRFLKQVNVVSADFNSGNYTLLRLANKPVLGQGGRPAARGLNVAVVSKGRLVLVEGFDTYKDATAADKFAALISKLPKGTFVVVVLHRHWTKRFNQNAQKALLSLGGHTGLLGMKRIATYILIGGVGLPPGQAIELSAPYSVVSYPQSLPPVMKKEIDFLVAKHKKEMAARALQKEREMREKDKRRRQEALGGGKKERKEVKKERKEAKREKKG